MNKFNKKAVISMHAANICQLIAFRLQKTLIFAITYNMLTINVIDLFNEYKKTNQFQEVPFLTSKTGVSCR